MKIIGIIPARLASTRFPSKPLVDMGGKSMIQRVYEQAQKSTVLDYILVATDHSSIYDEVTSFGGNVVLTSANCKNGTERCAEALKELPESFDIVINIQGDEPFFEPESLQILNDCFANESVGIATLVKEIEIEAELYNSTVVKVVFDNYKKALYFSRNALPYRQNESKQPSYKHIGIYAYRADILQELVQLEPSKLEIAESLEQLRWLENDYSIHVGITNHDSNSVDTPEDLITLKKQFGIE